VYNYRWHWRHILRVIESHPGNFFALWTNAPLEPNSTNASQATLSKWFCAWAKDTLAAGLDPEFGPFPANAYVFDFFHKLTGTNGMMLSQYAEGPGNSHPNASATELVAPQFVSEIFNAAIGYELIYGITEDNHPPENYLKAFPNPFQTETLVQFNISGEKPAQLRLFNFDGKEISTIPTGNLPGSHSLKISGNGLPEGIYFLQLTDGSSIQTIKLILAK